MIDLMRKSPWRLAESMESGVTSMQEHIEQQGSDYEESLGDSSS